MAITRIDISTFLQLAAQHPVIDVRSEGEYNQAHFPGAVSMPLFNNEERKVVGTAYKQESQQIAIKLGLNFFGPKMVGMVEQVEALLQQRQAGKTVIVYCWRGGMRSGGVGWLLDLYGFKVYTLAGGYKAFRKWGISQFEKDYPIKLVGGFTGTGKTEVLQVLKQMDQQVVDLEGLAHHKGSAFGNIGMPLQPSQEMFENKLALALWQAMVAGSATAPPTHTLWLEDESQRIGSVNIPGPLFQSMMQKPLFFLDVPFEERLQHIVLGYGHLEQERLVNAILRIQKRLGGMDTKLAINYLIEGKVAESFRILLKYYDKLYRKSLQSRIGQEDLMPLACTGANAVQNAQLILAQQKQEINV